MVKEFYVNIPEQQDYQVYVRGKSVKINNATINRLYKLPNIHKDGYHQYLEHELNLDEVLDDLTLLCIVWKFLKEESATFHSKAINNAKVKAWYYFVSTRLKTTFHIRNITQDHVVLLWAILKNKSINVRQLITRYILHSSLIKSIGGLYYPTIIMMLYVGFRMSLLIPFLPHIIDKHI